MNNAQLAAKLLRDAASLFRNVGGRDILAEERVDRFATLYESVADRVESEPLGEVPRSNEST